MTLESRLWVANANELEAVTVVDLLTREREHVLATEREFSPTSRDACAASLLDLDSRRATNRPGEPSPPPSGSALLRISALVAVRSVSQVFERVDCSIDVRQLSGQSPEDLSNVEKK